MLKYKIDLKAFAHKVYFLAQRRVDRTRKTCRYFLDLEFHNLRICDTMFLTKDFGNGITFFIKELKFSCCF